jgi:hypothetical protein
MPWSLSLPEDRPWVELDYHGVVTPAELMAAFEELMSACGGRTLFLADCTRLVGNPSPVELLRLIERFDTSPQGRRFREAILVPEVQAADAVRFYETACLNRGFQVRVFGTREAAEAWLTDLALRHAPGDVGSQPDA